MSKVNHPVHSVDWTKESKWLRISPESPLRVHLAYTQFPYSLQLACLALPDAAKNQLLGAFQDKEHCRQNPGAEISFKLSSWKTSAHAK